MKHNNNNQILSLFSTILLYFALSTKCNAYPSRSANAPSPDDGVIYDNSPSFSGSFIDILKGTFRGHITLPEHIHPPTQHNPALKAICHHTDYPDVCLSTISPFIVDNNCEVTRVLEASMIACAEGIKIMLKRVEKHAKESSHENTGSASSDCKEQLSNSLESLQKAVEALQSHDIGTVMIRLSSVMSDIASCESGFQDLKASYKPDSDGSVSIMASNCLVIASLVPSN